MRRSLLLSLALLSLGACSDADILSPTELSNGANASARSNGYKMVLLRASAPNQPGDAGAPLVNSLAEAVERVAPGGTIRVFPGEYSLESVLVDKPVTIEGAGTTKPVFVTRTSLEGLLLRHGTGTVTVRGVVLRNDFAEAFRDGRPVFSYSIRANQVFANVTVENSDFLMATGGHASGLLASGGGVEGNSALVIDRSTFTNGRAAVAATGSALLLPPSSISITNSTFTGQRSVDPGVSNFAIQVRSENSSIRNNTIADCGDRCVTASGIVELRENSFSDCGFFYCLQAAAAVATVEDNFFSNSVSNEDFFFHHVVLFNSGSQVTFRDNEITGCGFGHCITAIRGATGSITGNRITARHGERTRMGIVLSDGEAGNAGNPAFGASFDVSGNVITATGTATPDAPYAYSVSGLHVEGFSAMRANRNSVSSADAGIFVRSASSIEGQQNTITGSRVGVLGFDAGTRVAMRWNDFVAYDRAFDFSGESSSDLTCNWWDGAAGPRNFGTSAGASLYTPWATEPVAAAGTGTCS